MTKISDLPKIDVLDGIEFIPIVKDGQNFRADPNTITSNSIKTFETGESDNEYPENWQGQPIAKNSLVTKDGLIFRVKNWPWAQNAYFFDQDNEIDYIVVGGSQLPQNEEFPEYGLAPVTFGEFSNQSVTVTIDFPPYQYAQETNEFSLQALYSTVNIRTGSRTEIRTDTLEATGAETGGIKTFTLPLYTDTYDIGSDSYLEIAIRLYENNFGFSGDQLAINFFNDRDAAYDFAMVTGNQQSVFFQRLNSQIRFEGAVFGTREVWKFSDDFNSISDYDANNPVISDGDNVIIIRKGRALKLWDTANKNAENYWQGSPSLSQKGDLLMYRNDVVFPETQDVLFEQPRVLSANSLDRVFTHYENPAQPGSVEYDTYQLTYSNQTFSMLGWVSLNDNYPDDILPPAPTGEVWINLYNANDPQPVFSEKIADSIDFGSGFNYTLNFSDQVKSGYYITIGISEDSGETFVPVTSNNIFIYSDAQNGKVMEVVTKKLIDDGKLRYLSAPNRWLINSNNPIEGNKKFLFTQETTVELPQIIGIGEEIILRAPRGSESENRLQIVIGENVTVFPTNSPTPLTSADSPLTYFQNETIEFIRLEGDNWQMRVST